MDSCMLAITFVLLFGLCTTNFVGNDFKEQKVDESCATEFKGCKLQAGDCVCGTTVACVNPYPYISKHQCEKDVTGDLDKCRKDPCEHGQCVQIKKDDGYRTSECSCAGSGYYGKRCQIECPPLKKGNPIPEDYPTDCIY